MFRWLLNLPFLLLWNFGYFAVRVLLFMSRWISPGLLLLLLIIVPLLGFSLPRMDRVGSYVMVVAAVALAFIAGQRSRRK
jgi:hypothetical protein